MTDQNLPPVPPSEPTPPNTPEVPAAPAYAAPADSEVPPAPAYGAPQAPPAPAYGEVPPAPAYGAPAYGAPAAGYGQPAFGAAPKTNTFAIVSLVASIAGLFTGITFLVGIIFGHLSLSQIKKTAEGGRGRAIAGLVIGYIGLVVGIIVTIALIAFFAALASNPNFDTGYTY
jgi:hypothetical protein